MGAPGMPREEKSASPEPRPAAQGRAAPVAGGRRGGRPASAEPRPSAHVEAEPVGSTTPYLHPAATEITAGLALWKLSVFSPGPSLPAAKTTAIPASWSAGLASL